MKPNLSKLKSSISPIKKIAIVYKFGFCFLPLFSAGDGAYPDP
jgi:hypothetical protein